MPIEFHLNIGQSCLECFDVSLPTFIAQPLWSGPTLWFF